MEEKEVKYLNYIKERFPETETKSVKYNFEDGLHNDIVIVNESDVFRFAKHDWSKDFLHREINVVNLVRNYVDMPVPEFEYVERGVVKSNFFSGTPLFRNHILSLDEEAQESIAKEIGVFLKQLHTIPMELVMQSGIEGFPGNGRREDYLALLEIVKTKLFPYMKSYTREFITQLYQPLIDNETFLSYEPALIHGDIAPFHFFYSKELNKINGVIDFGVAGYGDPAHDVGVILDNFGESFVKRMSRYYSEIKNFIDRSRFYAGVSSLWWALRGFESKDVSWHLLHIHTAREIMPFGKEL